ncbi:MAG: LCP family protein [Kibdelosporangium sp.]
MDPISMTTEMEAISEGVQQIRRVDATLARFSAVHDELAEEERLKKEKRERLMPWLKGEGEDDAEPDVLPVDQPGNLDQELAELPTVLVEPQEEPPREAAAGGSTRKPPANRKLLLTGRITAASIAVVLLVATGFVWGTKQWVDDQFNEVAALDQNSADIKDGAAQLGDENFLMVGSDTREGASAEDGVGDAKGNPGARADTIMVAHIPKDRKRVVMASFPRDLEVQIPACDKYDSAAGKYPGGQTRPERNQKLNKVFQVGGPKCVTKVIQNLTGLKINHFVGIDFQGFKGMVQAVDGVEVCVERPMWDTTLNTWIVQQPGQQVKLSGDAALNFVRARHVQDSPARDAKGDPTSDYGRIKRQQRFLSSLLRKAMSSQVLLDVNKLTNFVGEFTKATFGEGVDTDQLMTLGRSLQNVGAGKVTFVTVPTVGLPNDRGNEVLRPKDNQNLFDAIIKELPLPGEQGDGGPQAQAGGKPPESLQAQQQGQLVDPKTVKVQVINSGAKDGEGRKAATGLRAQGFTVMQAVDGKAIPATVVKYGTDLNAAFTAAAAVPGAKLEQDPALGGAVLIFLGPNYGGKITAPNAAGVGAPGTTAPPTQPQLPKDLATINAGDIACA